MKKTFLLLFLILSLTIISAEVSAAANIPWYTGGGSGGGGTSVTSSATITDNAIVRGDGGARGVQESGILIDDSDFITGVGKLTFSTDTNNYLADMTDFLLVYGAQGSVYMHAEDISSTTAAFRFTQASVNRELTGASGQQIFFSITPEYDQSGTAGGTDLLINRTETAVGSGAQYLIQFQVDGTMTGGWTNAAGGKLTFGSNDFYYINTGGGMITVSGLNGVQLSASADEATTHMFKMNSGAGDELTGDNEEQAWFYIEPKVNQTSTAGYIGLLMDVTETGTGSGTNNLIDLRVASSSKFYVENDGDVWSRTGKYKGSTVRADGGATTGLSMNGTDKFVCGNNYCYMINAGYAYHDRSVTCSSDTCAWVETASVHFVTTENAGGADVLTITDGATQGYVHVIELKTDGGDNLEITPTNFANGTKVTLDAAGESVIIMWDGSNWFLIGTYGGIVS